MKFIENRAMQRAAVRRIGGVVRGRGEYKTRKSVWEEELKMKKEREYQKRLQSPVDLYLPPMATSKSLSNLMGVRTLDILKLMIRSGGNPMSATELLSDDQIQLICDEFGFQPKQNRLQQLRTNETKTLGKKEGREAVVAIMGHVNHGKTSILDVFRSSNRVSREAGGITQQLGAFRVPLSDGKSITFLDTPGHNAFFGMRKRGVSVTDVVILVIAADEGMLRQTEEALQIIQAAKVPFIVALNKMDKKNADPLAVCAQLQAKGVDIEEFGGDVQVVEVSAETGKGIEDLKAAIVLQTEMMDLEGVVDGPGVGVVMDTRKDHKLGMIASLLVRQGSIKVKDAFVCGQTWGKAKSIRDSEGKPVKVAGPSTPVEVTGFKGADPIPGTTLRVVSNEKEARTTVSRIGKMEQLNAMSRGVVVEGEGKDEVSIPFIVRGDSGGVSTLKDILAQYEIEGGVIRVVESGVGPVIDSDIELAATTGAKIISYGNKVSERLSLAARNTKVELFASDIVFDIVEEVRQTIAHALPRERHREVKGEALISKVFTVRTNRNKSRLKVMGAAVKRGEMVRKGLVRVLRDGEVLYDGPLRSLQQGKDNAEKISQGNECGMSVADDGFVPAVNDVVESYVVRYEVPQIPLPDLNFLDASE